MIFKQNWPNYTGFYAEFLLYSVIKSVFLPEENYFIKKASVKTDA